MSRHGRKNGIPDRWLDYQAVGRRLHGTRFIAFKVPLNQHLNRQLQQEEEVFGPWELLEAVRAEQQELGQIIDLTYTTRYYSLEDLPDSLMFVKIFTAGQQVPSDDAILSFKRAVRRFLRDNADNDKLIGVHCTHGLNRTGYLVCRYLIDVDGMDPEEAVELFNTARGHHIERVNYLEDLKEGPKRSNEGMDECDQVLEPSRGLAARRPSLTPAGRDITEERRGPGNDPWFHRPPYPPRGFNPHHHDSHRHDHRLDHRHDHRQPYFAPPRYHQQHEAPPHSDPYRWSAPPPPDRQWGRAPPHPRYGPGPGPQDWRDPAPPPPHHHHQHQHYSSSSSSSSSSPGWTDQWGGGGGYDQEQWAGPKTRHHPYRHTHSHTHRANGYNNH